MSYKDDIPKFIQELSKAVLNDFNEIQTIIGTRRIFKKHLKINDTKMQNCMIDMYLERIHTILFPEDINDSDSVDDVFLDVNLELLTNLIMAKPWELLLSEEIQENLESLGDCIRANVKERQNMLKLIPPNTHVEVVSSIYTPSLSGSISKMTSTRTALMASLNIEKKSAISRQSVVIKKKVTPKKKAIYKHVKPFQWRVQLRKKKKVVQKKQKLCPKKSTKKTNLSKKTPIPNSD